MVAVAQPASEIARVSAAPAPTNVPRRERREEMSVGAMRPTVGTQLKRGIGGSYGETYAPMGVPAPLG